MKAKQPIQSRNYNYDTMTLVVEETGKPVCKGDIVDRCVILGGTAPHKPSSTGRILVESHGMMTEFFPNVFGLKWVGGAQ